MSDTLNSVVAIIREAVPGAEINPEADGDRSFKELGIDSLDKMSLLLGIQEKWNLEFTEQEIAELNSINDICRKVG
ncbi:acyl carrier protein [Prosthecobacter debontii]|uniref:Acyl carrier protein n=1 Tax=Prosthecobacter debontii TaxID=48467 RepID=A0A1T4XTI8_9BACT|nr:acyl carrier protein [Prosthecobacter debontii]SKA92834.1 acyl carrier protein [Prosthecobacter debontii]